MLRQKTEQLIKYIINNPCKDNILPGNVFYLNDDEILCLPREGGESRFPYQANGLRVYAYSTGFIHANKSTRSQ